MKTNKRFLASPAMLVLAFGALPAPPAMAQVGSTTTTLATPMELPVEVEIELSPAVSLKQAPLWKELIQLLRNPYAPVVRRPGFGVTMPALDVYPLDYNFLTGDTLRLRTSDGETAWDVPGPLFDPAEAVTLNEFNTPINDPATPGGDRRTPIGALVSSDDATLDASDFDNVGGGYLIVSNPSGNPLIPPNGTVVAVPAVVGGVLQELAGTTTTATEDIVGPLEIPVNEEDFFRPTTDTTGVNSAPLLPYLGRAGAEVLGKALFWDMQVGGDAVQSCASCHFHAGVDNRSKAQLNSGINGGDNVDLNVHINAGRPNAGNQDVVATDFPFHKRVDPETPGDGTDPAIVVSDANDVMSSMGVSQFKLFNDIPPIGLANFLPAVNGVRSLAPDIATVAPDPVPINQGFRRIEPRNTPTFHGAAFNNDNFWDGRARMALNGGSVFGAADPQAHIFINPGLAVGGNGAFAGATMGDIRPDLLVENPELAAQPVRIKFSSLGSQSLGPPLSDFEMSFAGRNWAKIGKKFLQGDNGAQATGNGAPQQAGTNRENAVVPLANQLVATDDSVLGPFSNQGGSVCATLGRPTAVGKPGLCIAYSDLTRLAFGRQFWNRTNRHLNGAAGTDPFDAFVLTVANGAANPNDTFQFSQMEANFSLFFSLAVQAYEELTIPDHTPADQFFDANPLAGHAVGEPGDQAVLFPTLIPDLLDDGLLNGTNSGTVTLVDGFGPDELFGFDLFAGANLTAALAPGQSVGASGRDRNPVHTITRFDGSTVEIRVGSNPFTRSAKCMLCHLGPEQTDASINIDHGLLKNDAEFEFPTPPQVPDPLAIFAPNVAGPFAGISTLPSPEPSGSSKTVPGLILAEEIEGAPQDAVEVEPRNMAVLDNPLTPWDDRLVSQPGNFAFGDQGMYNVGLRPIGEDIGRGGGDPFGWPLSNSALTLKNIGGAAFEPCDGPGDSCVMANVDPNNFALTFEPTGEDLDYPGAPGYTLQSVNPGFEKDPITPMLPAHLYPWVSGLSAGELHPQVDEIGGMYPNTITPPNGGPGIEFPEVIFGADFHCARYDPAIFGAGPPSFGWGPFEVNDDVCPNNHSGVANNFDFPIQGTWPVPNRVLRDGAFKAPALRNVELTGPFFHTGSYLTLRQVVDFYFRGGDFPITNAENRDPHVVDLDEHAFSFGRTTGRPITINGVTYPDDLGFPINMPGVPDNVDVPATPYIRGPIGFRDGLPDTVFLYDEYPDLDHPVTPEPAFASRAEAIEDAKNSIVKFLLALTDPRTKFEQAPFDRPQILVPVDGIAPDNTGGPVTLAALSSCSALTPCTLPGLDGVLGTADDVVVTTPLFRNIPAVGAAGNATPLPGFLGVTSIPPGAPGFSCSAASGAVSHFCAVVTP